VDEALIRIAGVNPSFMRPPYGEYNDAVRQVAASRGQVLTLWDYDSDGSRPPTAQSIQGYTDLAARHPLNALTLNHETNGAFSAFWIVVALDAIVTNNVAEGTAHEVLPHAIRVLQAAGYNLVTVAECLGMSPYQSVTALQTVCGSTLIYISWLLQLNLRAHGVAK
jgi:peptidoglycan/xylan/chitin deacetylase (PgdA/CDA1 family)